MRIIAGKYKSRQIKFPLTKSTRPMMDRMRESVFNILSEEVKDVRVLDLFCGSGSLGLEAISRGAGHVTFVDSELAPCDTVRKNLRILGISNTNASVMQLPVSQALRLLNKKHRKFDLVFLDPPYNKGFIKKILHQLERFDIVNLHGKVVIQRARQEPLPADILNFQIIEERKMGQAYIVFLRRSEGSDLTHEQIQA